MLEAIKNLRYLPEADKTLLAKHAAISYGHGQHCLPELSIFKSRLLRSTFEGCEITQIKDEPIYYAGLHSKTNLGIFFDEHKKIVFNSRFYLTHLNSFLQCIDACLYQLQNLDLKCIVDIGKNLLAIERWYITYGHFKDEAYTLGDVLERFPHLGQHRALLDYPTDDRLNTAAFGYNANYQKIDRLIFGKRSLNAYHYGSVPLKMQGLQLISNGFNSTVFHSFPPAVARRIRAQVERPLLPRGPARILLTRSSSYRDLGNKAEVEDYFVRRGFTVVNPEQISYEELVRQAGDAQIVASYYGSALTNMVYFQPGTRVYVLKSESYLEEKLTLWNKVIAAYQLDVVEVPAVDNIIDETLLDALDLLGGLRRDV